MLFNTKLKTTYLSFIIWLLFCNNLVATEYTEVVQEVKVLLDQFAIKSQETEMTKKWDNYLTELTGFNNNEYLSAIQQLYNEYYQSLTEHGNCCKKSAEEEKAYSSAWIGNFQNRFGKDYFSKNIDSIKFILISLHVKRKISYCEKFEKETIYREVHCFQAFRRYIRYFLEFIESLNEEDKKKFKNKKAIAESLLAFPVAPIQKIISDSGLMVSLRTVALSSRTNLDANVIKFLSQHSNFSEPFDIMKAVSDIEK